MYNEQIRAERVPGTGKGIWPFRTRGYDITARTPEGAIKEFTVRSRDGEGAIKKARKTLAK